MKFKYRAIKSEGEGGEELSGVRESADRLALARELRAEGLTAISVEVDDDNLTETSSRFSLFSFKLNLFNRISMKEKIMFAGSLSAMLGAGLSLSRSLEVMIRQSHNQKFKAVVTEISEKVSRGETLRNALASFPDIFPPVFVALVSAGEESGNLPKSLEIIRNQLAKSYDLRRKVRGAMIYPAIIIGVIILIGALMMIYFVPNLSAMFAELEVELPLATRIIIGISDRLASHPFLFLVSLIILVVIVVKFIRTKQGQLGVAWLSLRLPVIKTITRNFNAAITMRTLSSLISAGVSLIEGLTITERVIQNPYFKTVLVGAGVEMQRGASLSKVIKSREDLYPILVGEMAEVGEETGNLSGMLMKGAVFFEDEVDQSVKNLSTIIEPALMILIGLFVGLFAVSMIGPMYSLSEAI